jgi:hypothetical protein
MKHNRQWKHEHEPAETWKHVKHEHEHEHENMRYGKHEMSMKGMKA